MPNDTVVSAAVPKGKALPRFGPGGGSSGGGGGSSGAIFGNQYSGAGSPEGVVVGSIGDIYTNTNTGGLWTKTTNSGQNTGWIELVF